MNIPTDWHEWVFWYLALSAFVAGASLLTESDYRWYQRIGLGLLWPLLCVTVVVGVLRATFGIIQDALTKDQ